MQDMPTVSSPRPPLNNIIEESVIAALDAVHPQSVVIHSVTTEQGRVRWKLSIDVPAGRHGRKSRPARMIQATLWGTPPADGKDWKLTLEIGSRLASWQLTRNPGYGKTRHGAEDIEFHAGHREASLMGFKTPWRTVHLTGAIELPDGRVLPAQVDRSMICANAIWIDGQWENISNLRRDKLDQLISRLNSQQSWQWTPTGELKEPNKENDENASN